MLKNTILVLAALGAVMFASSETADAAVRHRTVARVGWSHAAPIRHAFVRHAFARHSAMRLASARPAFQRRAFVRSAHAPSSRFAWRGRHAFAHYAYARGRHYGRHHLALASRDAMIRNYVGPRSAYAPVTTSAGLGVQTGGASYYSGGRTADGGLVGAATCAHRSLPFGTRVLVTNLANAHHMVLTVNDRGPFVRGRILDVSRVAAASLGMLQSGTAPVRIQVVGGPG